MDKHNSINSFFCWRYILRCGLLTALLLLFSFSYAKFSEKLVSANYSGGKWSYLNSVCPKLAPGTGNALTEYGKTIINHLEEAALNTGIDKALLLAVMGAESNCREKAVSSAGAIGLMQLMPKTAKWLAVADPYSPRQNILGGAKYLSMLHGMFDGDLELILAAYNSGPGTVRRYGGVPPYPETKRYVEKVFRHYQTIKDADDRLAI